MENEEKEYLDPRVLADGNILKEKKEELAKDPSNDKLYNLLGILRDSVVYIPMQMVLSDADKERMSKLKEGEQFTPQDDMSFAPDTVKGKNDELYIPVFSQTQQIPQDYADNFQIMPIKSINCLKLAHGTDGVSGLVLDPFTTPLMLPYKMVDILPTIPSSLKPKEKLIGAE